MEIGWYLNHSDDPNVYHDEQYFYYSLKDIKAGEELFIDYSSLEDDSADFSGANAAELP
jgi:SET domain-containing protein